MKLPSAIRAGSRSLATWFSLATIACAQGSRPTERPHLPGPIVWSHTDSGARATVAGEGAAKGKTLLLPLGQCWRMAVEQGGVSTLITLFTHGPRDLASAGSARSYLRGFHGEPTDEVLLRLLQPADTKEADSRRRRIDRIAAMRLVLEEDRTALVAHVKAIARGEDARHDSGTRRSAEELVARFASEPRPVGAARLESFAGALANLPASSEVVILVDAERFPRSERIPGAILRLAQTFTLGAAQQAGLLRNPDSLANMAISFEFGAISTPLVVAECGELRTSRSVLGFEVGSTKISSVLALPGFHARLLGDFDVAAVAQYADGLAKSGAPLRRERHEDRVSLAIEPAREGNARSLRGVEVDVSAHEVVVRQSREAKTLGAAAAKHLLDRWRSRVPSSNAVWMNAKLASIGTFELGVLLDAGATRVEGAFECESEKRAVELLDEVRGYFDRVREPREEGRSERPELTLLRAAHAICGRPTITQEGKDVRVVLSIDLDVESALVRTIAKLEELAFAK